MSENKDDLELEALQRQLDDAFGSTRPRRGFEDELWLRMQARRSFGARLRDVFGSVAAGFRAAPAIPIGAVAVALVVVIGAGVLLSNGLRIGGESSTLSQGAAQAPGRLALGDAGKLPSPALHPGLVDTATPPGLTYSAEPATHAAPPNLYFGPAHLTWTGTFPGSAVEAPVYRYMEPTSDQMSQFLVTIGPGLNAVALATQPQLPRPPVYVVSASGNDVPPGSDPVDVANTFLGTHNLAPQWPNAVTVKTAGGTSSVRYARGFAANGGTAYLIDWNGEPSGIEVDLGGGKLVATGPLPVVLDQTQYRLVSNDRAAALAISSTPASAQAIQPTPDIVLTSVELVYALAVANGQGFYEPCYLFSGTFSYNGQTYTKRVLVPLVA